MSDEISGVAERLVQEFTELPWKTVFETVCRCAQEREFDSPLFVEQAVRATLTHP